MVRMVVDSIVRLWAHPVVKKLPTTVVIVKKIVKKFIGLDYLKSKNNFNVSITDWRVAIKTIFKFVAIARFEEAIELKKNNFKLLPSGDLEVTFLKGKNYSCFDARTCVISKLDSQFCPVRLILKYFERLDFSKGVNRFFLPIVQSKVVKRAGARRNIRVQVAVPGRAISYDTCSRQFKEALTAVGENASLFGEHSDRIGGLSAAANNDVPWEAVNAHGRWAPGSKVSKSYHKKSLKKRKIVTLNLGL